ncbi:MAG: 3-dehydroquinate synthase [Dehalococcoidia bacterium]|nr:3-dehydroquinate synthase [Dehalococcoidia bacterium]
MERQVSNIILAGFSATGKSFVGREVARRLSWGFVDTDEEIVKQAGKPISEIFQQDGEAKFRGLERHMIKKACQQKKTVIAIGGGAIVDSQNYKLLARNGLIICLEAKPETIYQRLFRDAASTPETEVRPLLSDNNPLERITNIKASRQPYYAKAHWTVHTDDLSISEVAEEVVRAWELLREVYPERDSSVTSLPQNDKKRRASAHHNDKGKGRNDTDKDIACEVKTTTQNYPIFVGYGLLDKLGEKIKQTGLSGTVNIISDETVFSIYGHKVGEIVKHAGFEVNSFVVPPGEATKNTDFANRIYDFLVEHRAERDDILIALGGGMVGDLAGFVAATFLRGVPWIQVPTSLLAMVDASIGGKVGVNHPRGKNLIGAFYQPNFVLADCQTLTTLSQRELTSGWAEVIKYGLILDEEFFKFLKTNAAMLMKLEPDVLTQAVARSAAIKAQVVTEDEKEKGKRTLLNYGHTIAHGLEAATQYRQFLHGEAVAIGMVGAGKLSQRLGFLSPAKAKQHQSLLQRFDLPVSFSKIDLTDVERAMELDKKARGGVIRWVLLENIGKAVIHSSVPRQDVLAVLQELLQP